MKYILLSISLLFSYNFASAQSYNQHTNNIDQTDNRPFTYVQKMPSAGYDFSEYLSEHLHYPEAARLNNITGKVIIQFVINEDGTISNCKIVRGIGGGCDEEALKVIENMPPWKAGTQEGKPVKVYFTVPINFALEDPKKGAAK